MFHKEGHTIILTSFLITVGLTILVQLFIENETIKRLLFVIFLILLVLILQFFRNPKRTFTKDSNSIVSPVDGKVVVIEEVFENEYFQDKRLQVSVFMSPLNVHVTRYPVSGTIKYSKYHPGKYLVAWHPKASEENERTTVVVHATQWGDIMYRQIAGAVAKRVVNYAKEGNQAIQAEDSGFIKFGSRVDVFLPLDTKITVQLNQKVKGGITILAKK